MAGTFSNFMRGYEGARRQRFEDEDRQFQRAEREYMQGRRGVLDQRQDVGWEQGQEDRSRMLERDAQEYPLRLRSLEQGVESGDLGLESQRFQVGRQPIEARYRDEAHTESMAGQRQGRGIRASQEARAQAQHRIQMEMAELGLDEAKLQREHQEFVRTIGGPARRFMMTGDPKPISEAWRQAIGGDGELVQQKDGSYAAIAPNGEVMKSFGSREDVIDTLSMFASQPEAFLELRYQQATGQGRGGQRQPAAIQEAQFVAEILPRRQGESEREHMLRAYEITKLRNMERPEAARQRIAMELVRDASAMPGRQLDRDTIARQVDEIMGVIYGGQETTSYGLRDRYGDDPDVDPAADNLIQEPQQPQRGGGLFGLRGAMNDVLRSRGWREPDAGRGTGGPVTVSTEAEYQRLPSGTRFIDPNGTIRIKP